MTDTDPRSRESVLRLLRHSPDVVVTVLRDVMCIDVPEYFDIAVEPGDCLELPASVPPPDLVLVLRQGQGDPVATVIVDVLSDRDPARRSAWNAQVIAAYARLPVPVALFCYACDEETATWAREPQPGPAPAYLLMPRSAAHRGAPSPRGEGEGGDLSGPCC